AASVRGISPLQPTSPRIARRPPARIGYPASSGQVGPYVVALDELLQRELEHRARGEADEVLALLGELLAREGLHEALAGHRGLAVELGGLARGEPGDAQALAGGHDLADEPRLLGLLGVDAAAREQQIADQRVGDVAAQPGDAAEAGH